MNSKQTDLKKFHKALTCGEPFKKRYSLLNDSIIVILKWPEKAEVDMILEEIERQRKEGVSSSLLKRRLKEYKLSCSMTYLETPRLSLAFESPSEILANGMSLKKLSAQRLDFLSECLYNTLVQISDAFKRLLEELLQKTDIGVARDEMEQFIRDNKELL